MNQKLEYRSSSWEAQEENKLVGYAIVFNQRTVLFKDPLTGDEYGEEIDRHALDNADMSDVVLRYNHEGRVLARTRNGSLKLKVTDYGLKIEADMTGSDEARSFYGDVKSGLIDKMSFAFFPSSAKFDSNTNTRTVTGISRLEDVSIVDFPAYQQTEVSARSRFEELAEPRRKAYFEARAAAASQNTNINELRTMFSDLTKAMKDVPESEQRFMKIEADAVAKRIGEYDSHQRRLAYAERMVATGTPVYNPCAEEERRSQFRAYFNNTTNEWSNTMNTTSKSSEFFAAALEQRSAGSSATMSAVIPKNIVDAYVLEMAPGAFLADCQTTAVERSGDLYIPITSLQDVQKHEENAEIEAVGYVPGVLTVTHDEYAYNVAYSRKGIALTPSYFDSIINTTIMQSMMKKMDGICIDAVAGLTYDTSSSVTVSSAPTLANFVSLAGMLGSNYIDAAKWYMNSATYFTWVLGLLDANKKPIFDPSKKIEDQALLGYPLAIDSQIPTGTIYFGDGHRVHLNYAQPIKLDLWTDHDHNTEKAGVNTVAGAAVEPGAFVKLSK